jgi:2'-5' RNA ligase
MTAVENANGKTSALMPGTTNIPGLSIEKQKKFGIGDRDVNQDYESGFADPAKDEARRQAHPSEQIPGTLLSHVKDTANDMDTGWYLSQDPKVWDQAVQNAFRVALLSPRKDFKWNATHYQDMMHLPVDATANDIFHTLENARRSHNVGGGHEEFSHSRYDKARIRVAARIKEMDPSVSDDDAQGIAFDVLANALGTAEKAYIHSRMRNPKYYDSATDEWKSAPSALSVYSKGLDIVKAQFEDPKKELSDSAQALLAGSGLQRLTPDLIDERIHEVRSTYEPGSRSSQLTPEQLEKGKLSSAGHKGEKYGAFVYGHLQAIENVGKYASKLGKYARDDVIKHGGGGHYFRNQVLKLGVPGMNSKVVSFAWLLLAPRTSELGTMDTHMTRFLTGSEATNTYMPGIDDQGAGKPLSYYGYERMLKAIRDEMGYSDLPLGQFQWVMWDLVRQGSEHADEELEPGSDHRTVKVDEPKPHWETDWPETKTRKSDPRYHPAPWMHDAFKARSKAAYEYYLEHGGSGSSNHPDPDNPVGWNQKVPLSHLNFRTTPQSRRNYPEREIPAGVTPEGHQAPHESIPYHPAHVATIVHEDHEDVAPDELTGEEVMNQWDHASPDSEEPDTSTAVFVPYTGPKYEGEDDPMHHNASVADDWVIVKTAMPEAATEGPQFQQDVKQRMQQGVEPLHPSQRHQYYMRGHDWETIPENIHALHSLSQYPLKKPVWVDHMRADDDAYPWEDEERPQAAGYHVPVGGTHQIRLNPLQPVGAANATLWHELQHAYQLEEGRHPERDDSYQAFSDEPGAYWDHPSETDARGMESIMKTMPLVRRAEPQTRRDWFPNRFHLDGGDWDPQEEEYRLSDEKMNDWIRRYRSDAYGRKASVNDDWEIVAAADLDGTMVSLDIPKHIGQGMAVEGGEPVDNLHTTLAYLPNGIKDHQATHKILQDVSKQFGPIEMAFDKMHHFPETKDGDIPMVAMMKGDKLHDLHQAVKSGLEAVGEEVSDKHDFKPHITLKYLQPDETHEGEDPDASPFTVPHVSLHSGGNVTHYPLGANVPAPVTARTSAVIVHTCGVDSTGLATYFPRELKLDEWDESIARAERDKVKLQGFTPYQWVEAPGIGRVMEFGKKPLAYRG